jgi:arabinofuranan 3-O-arabinosyltransferase
MTHDVADTRVNSALSSNTGWITGRRLWLYSTAVALGYLLGLLLRAVFHQPWRGADSKPCTDFIWIWLSSKYALSGAVARAYDYPLFSAAYHGGLDGTSNCVLEHLDYPPTLLFFTYPLGLTTYSVAFVIWIGVTLLLYLAAVYAVLPRSASVLAALTPFPVFFNIQTGHNGFLTAGLFGLALVLLERRPGVGGIFVGLLTYKPQLGVLFPLALLVSRNWRALYSAAATSVLFAAAAAVAFGYQSWPAFIGALNDRALALSENPQGASAGALVSVFGVLRSLNVSAPLSWSAQLALTAIVATVVSVLSARPLPYSLKAAALAAGSLLASPHAHGYDACILTIAGAFFVKDGLARGFLPGERASLVACWAVLFLLTGPFPALVSTAFVILVFRRACALQSVIFRPAMAASGREAARAGCQSPRAAAG